MGTFRCCWGSMGLLLRPFRVYGSISLIEWALLGGLWALLGTYELFIWTADGPFWELMGPFWELMGRFWELMGPFWELMGPFGSWWALFGSWWALLGSWWALFGSWWALFGSWRALFGISWAPLYTSSYTFYAFFILFYIHFFLQFFKNFGPRGSYPAIPALSVGLLRWLSSWWSVFDKNSSVPGHSPHRQWCIQNLHGAYWPDFQGAVQWAHC